MADEEVFGVVLDLHIVDVQGFLHGGAIHVELVDIEHLEGKIVDELLIIRVESVFGQVEVDGGSVHEGKEVSLAGRLGICTVLGGG